MANITELTTREKTELDRLKLAYEIAELDKKEKRSSCLNLLDIISKVAAISTPFILFILGIHQPHRAQSCT